MIENYLLILLFFMAIFLMFLVVVNLISMLYYDYKWHRHKMKVLNDAHQKFIDDLVEDYVCDKCLNEYK